MNETIQARAPHSSFQPRELPSGWRWVRLGDVCETGSGGTPARGNRHYYGGEIPWIKSGELCDGLVCSTEETLTQEGLFSSSAKIIPRGTLLIAMYGATVGRLGVCGMDATTNQAICAILPCESVDRDFLFFHLLKIRQVLVETSFEALNPILARP
jgi:type I restriction enzyme S subunit